MRKIHYVIYFKIVSLIVRFIITACIVLLPFCLYFFEVLRFRLFSRYLEKKKVGAVVSAMLKPLGNLLLWLTWPLVAFFRQFWSRFQYETAVKEEEVSAILSVQQLIEDGFLQK